MAQPTTDELRTRIEQQRSALGDDLDAIGDRISPRRMTERRKAAASDAMRSLRTRVMGTVEHVGTATSQVASEAGERLSDAPAAARRQIQGNPLGAGLFAFAAGLVTAALLPETERERAVAQRAQPRLEEMAGEAGRTAQEAVDHLQPAARDAVEHVKGQAQEAADHVREQARPSS